MIRLVRSVFDLRITVAAKEYVAISLAELSGRGILRSRAMIRFSIVQMDILRSCLERYFVRSSPSIRARQLASGKDLAHALKRIVSANISSAGWQVLVRSC